MLAKIYVYVLQSVFCLLRTAFSLLHILRFAYWVWRFPSPNPKDEDEDSADDEDLAQAFQNFAEPCARPSTNLCYLS